MADTKEKIDHWTKLRDWEGRVQEYYRAKPGPGASTSLSIALANILIAASEESRNTFHDCSERMQFAAQAGILLGVTYPTRDMEGIRKGARAALEHSLRTR